MLDPIIQFFARAFAALGRGIGMVVAAILWPFAAGVRWWRHRGGIVKIAVGAIVALFVVANLYFAWQTQTWAGYDPDYAQAYVRQSGSVAAGEPEAPEADNVSARTCAPSQIVRATADLTDWNVDTNAWVPSMLFYKLGFFGVDWAKTPFFDNKAAFQRGVHSAVQRTAVELTDTLGRERGTSGIDADLRDARGNFQYREDVWYVTTRNGFPTPIATTPSVYRDAARSLRSFNERLTACNATFDARADNLINLLDRIAKDIGSVSEAIRSRSENSNAGWFDFSADNQFWFAMGQLYGYHGVLQATEADFADTIAVRGLGPLYDRMQEQLRTALDLSPLIVSNGDEDGFVMPTHLTTLGFYVLRVRANLVEIRSVLDR